MENFDFYEENLASAQMADGSLQEQADIYAESWDAASKRVTAAAQDIYDSITKLKTVKDNMDDMNTFVESNTRISTTLLNQYSSIVKKIQDSNAAFEDEYDEIYNNKYL